VPPIETCVIPIILLADNIFVEGLVMRVLQRDIRQPFKLANVTVADDLNFRLVRDSLEVRVEDRPFCVERFSVAIAGCKRIEETRYFILRFWRKCVLVFEEDDLVVVEGGFYDFRVGGGEVFEVRIVKFGAEVVG